MTDHHDDDDVLDIDEAIGEGSENDDGMPDGFHATDPETGLPIADDHEDDDEDEESETF